MNIQFEMNDEVAYKLGKMDFPHFYQYVQWKVNKEPFELAAFFNWSLPGGLGGWPCDNDHNTLWEDFQASGSLKTELIKENSHRLSYIRGRLSSYSVTITETSINVCYANSYNLRDFLVTCLKSVLMEKYRGCRFAITTGETPLSIPGTPWVKLEAEKEVIDYILGK